MKTDPQNSDYVMESGNFEAWRAEEDEEEDKEKKKALGDWKREMDVLSTLEIKTGQASLGVDAMLEALQTRAVEKEKNLDEVEDEALIRSIYQRQKEIIRRLPDDDDEDLMQKLSYHHAKKQKTSNSDNSSNKDKPAASNVNSLARFVVIKKPLQRRSTNRMRKLLPQIYYTEDD